jgi:hypothetical protein
LTTVTECRARHEQKQVCRLQVPLSRTRGDEDANLLTADPRGIPDRDADLGDVHVGREHCPAGGWARCRRELPNERRRFAVRTVADDLPVLDGLATDFLERQCLGCSR